MIRYRLQCNDGHEFEGWFRASADYDRQIKRREVSCPECGSAKVSKALMAPQIATSRKRANEPAPGQAAEPTPEQARQAAMRQQFVALMREVRREVEKNADYVGDRFADEARKIHHKEAEPRGIYGEATLDEAKQLNDEGIDVLPLPRLPEDQN